MLPLQLEHLHNCFGTKNNFLGHYLNNVRISFKAAVKLLESNPFVSWSKYSNITLKILLLQ